MSTRFLGPRLKGKLAKLIEFLLGLDRMGAPAEGVPLFDEYLRRTIPAWTPRRP